MTTEPNCYDSTYARESASNSMQVDFIGIKYGKERHFFY